MLSPSSLFLKIIGVLANNGGGNLEVVIGYLWQLVTLEHWHFCFLSGLDIHTSSFGLLGFGFPFSLIPFDLCCLHQASDPLVPECCHPLESCRRHVQEYNHSAVHILTSSSDTLFHHLPLVPYLVSLMGETLWPSCDGSSLFDINSLSKRLI